jgi:hypothetical protein
LAIFDYRSEKEIACKLECVCLLHKAIFMIDLSLQSLFKCVPNDRMPTILVSLPFIVTAPDIYVYPAVTCACWLSEGKREFDGRVARRGARSTFCTGGLTNGRIEAK